MGSSQAAASFLSKSGRAALSLGAAVFGLGAAATAVNSSLYTVDVGHRAVVFNRFRGILEETVGEGTHFLIPWVQKPYIFDIRTRPHTFSSISGTKDLQMVNLTLRVLSRPDTLRLPTIVQNLGLEYDEKVLPSIGNEILKAVVAQFNADQLLTQRPRVSALVRDALVRRAKDFNILLDDVAITHLSYDPEFYRKQEHERQANWEKDRIEAGKKLLKAQRIAEENQRKRFLALRKAAEEAEEKRARENILKKLEQDKERIEADKKLLEAKRIAEENERKRILGLRKAAAAEEEKRARENILKKLEQDKLNRRSELGLPLEGQATVRSPAIAVKQEKISKPVYTTTKVEHLRECLRSLKRQHQDEHERVRRAFETLLVYVRNVVKNPMEEKYRKIRLSNPLFQDRVGSLNGGVEFLELCGFERTGDFLYLPHEKVDVELLTKAGSVLNSAMTNPFFGLLSKDS